MMQAPASPAEDIAVFAHHCAFTLSVYLHRKPLLRSDLIDMMVTQTTV
jgi:hypothetical protein